MFNNKFWIGFVAVYLITQAFGFLVHAIMLDPQYQALASVFRTAEQMEALMWVMFATSLVYGFMFCFLYARGAFGDGWLAGAKYGFWIGLLFSVPQAFDAYAVYPITLELAVWWFVTGVVAWTVNGAVFGAIYRRA